MYNFKKEQEKCLLANRLFCTISFGDIHTIQWKHHILNEMKPNKIANAGIGYVPQGRRLFPSLSVEEHLTLLHRKSDSPTGWTPERVFEFFPELAERRKLSGTRLSGGEQQMLAIGRALLLTLIFFCLMSLQKDYHP